MNSSRRFCKTIALLKDLGQTTLQMKVQGQIPPLTVRMGELGLNWAKTYKLYSHSKNGKEV